MRRPISFLHSTIILVGIVFVSSVQAEDIDLFMNNAAPSSSNPNILIIIDTASANNSNITNTCGGANKKIDMERCIIANLVNSADVNDKVNMGLSVFNPTSGAKGAYIRYAVRQMTAANKTALAASVNGVTTSSNSPYAKTMHEAYLYYSGKTPYVGTTSNQYDSAAVAGGKYVSPATNTCQKNYIIFIGNGGPDSSENNDAESLLTALGGRLPPPNDPIRLNPSNYQSTWSDEYARFMYRSDFSVLDGPQNIVTYSIGVFEPTDTNQPAQASRALLKSMANQGGGKYFEASSSSALTEILKKILVEVQSVNSVFAAVALPVSVNVRGTYLNQVYMGVFRPDADALPRWVGNLKEYKLAYDETLQQAYMADVNGSAVASNSTGFVNSNAKSYWTSSSTFWSFKPSGAGLDSDSPDGDIVEKGAAAQWLRTNFATTQAARNVYTCTGTCGANSLLSGTPFNTSNAAITQAATGTSAASDPADLIKWTRGQDMFDENVNNSTTDVRASIHGDVLHSRPALVNYNRYGDNNDVFVFYGANDGMFHAIQGGQISSSGARQGGTEKWSFIPSEFLGQLKRLRDNDVNIKAPNPGKPYFVDGPIGVYQFDSNNDGTLNSASGDKVHLFMAMRRGGRLLYALDVSDPAAPRFLWKRSNTSGGYSELGQTWSEPKPAKIRAHGNPVLIMGAGYDAAAEDASNQGHATMGRGVMVIDATNGNVLWQVGKNPSGASYNRSESGMTHSIPADMAVLDRDRDGYADRVYAADTGGNLWRLDIDDANPNNWSVTKLAALGGNSRKFLYAPDVVYGTSGGTQQYDAVLIGSGDREHPFETTSVNRFYMVKDSNMGKSVAADFVTITEADLYDATLNLIQDGTQSQKESALASLTAAKGWYLTLKSGEKVVSNAITMGGTTFFGTNQPSAQVSGSCTNLGKALVYAISFLDASATLELDGMEGETIGDRADDVVGGGLPPPPVGIVTIVDGKPVQVVCSGTKCLSPPTEPLGRRYRVYWHNNLDK